VTAFVGGTSPHYRFWKTSHAGKTQKPEQEKDGNRKRAYIKDHEIRGDLSPAFHVRRKWHFAFRHICCGMASAEHAVKHIEYTRIEVRVFEMRVLCEVTIVVEPFSAGYSECTSVNVVVLPTMLVEVAAAVVIIVIQILSSAPIADGEMIGVIGRFGHFSAK
jgi:hypothetical protein